ncbi:CHAP domain-containing protein [Paramagnetospirillum kuznetsovii]|uniref:CHAP domain-containing protein n=1 Tax=Paramagnetospirillum kuznetsovii TaxID=2053833 RepID=UPI001EFCC817|nr:CHAP domain-containing protein [Paramagnetospirillum kuznetsovii]
MRKVSLLLVAAIALVVPFKANAALQCVAYAREITGLNIKGDAWRWWEAADGLYKRGNAPKEGAVLVFKRQGSMVHGHVAVVRKTTSSRIVLVDHANWAPRRSADRGKVQESVPVMDVSPNNDWTQVRVWYEPSAQYGDKTYKTVGFVYNPGKLAPVEQASVRDESAVAALPKADSAIMASAALADPAPTLSVPAVAPVVAPMQEAAMPEVPKQDSPKSEAIKSGKFDAGRWAEQA